MVIHTHVYILAILDQAQRLLPYVRQNRQSSYTVGSLEDIPWFVVLMFELLRCESIPAQLKPFNTVKQQAETLQRIIDTLEEVVFTKQKS